MTNWHPFQYRDFWDQPRILYTSDGQQSYLLDCPFDDQLDGYGNRYNVYLMPSLAPADLSGSWAGLEQKAIHLLGAIEIPASAFDPTRRAQLDLSILSQLAT